jgi:hypothetical protein
VFKRAYVRGVQNAMVQAGHVAYPDQEIAAKIADYVADHLPFEPHQEGGVPRAVTAKIAEAMVDASKQLASQGYKAAAFQKLASIDDLSKLAHQHALDLMQKAAEGSTIEGGDKGNKSPESPNAEAKMDNSPNYRPTGYAEDSRGKTDVDTRPGAVGKEQEHPKKPAEGGTGSAGSPVEQSRTASLESFLRKTAEGSTIQGGDKGNKQKDSIHAESKMDAAWRPPGYAVLPNQGGLGELMKMYGGASAIGKEQPHPMQPAVSPSGTNSVTETSQKHSAAAEDPYMALFKKTASEVHPYLPTGMSDEHKVAHVRMLMGLTTDERARYLTDLQHRVAEKTAATPAALPPGSRTDGYEKHTSEATHARPGAYDGRKANQGTKQAEDGMLPPFMMGGKKDEKPEEKKESKPDEKDDEKDEKKDEKKDDEKKEGSIDLVAALRQASAPQTHANA